MKLNKETLKQIIKEELDAVLGESRLLDRYVKDKDEEFKQYIRDMGKDPDEVIKALGPHSSNVMGQTVVDGYPEMFVDTPATRGYQASHYTNDIVPNPYGGRFFYTYVPTDVLSSGARKGSITLYAVEPQTNEMEFVTAYGVEDVEEELKKLAKRG